VELYYILGISFKKITKLTTGIGRDKMTPPVLLERLLCIGEGVWEEILGFIEDVSSVP